MTDIRTITINGKMYGGRPSYTAIVNIERDLSKPLIKVFNELGEDETPSISVITTVLRYCLHPLDNPKVFLSQEEWDELMADGYNLTELMDAFGQIVTMMFPQKKTSRAAGSADIKKGNKKNGT